MLLNFLTLVALAMFPLLSFAQPAPPAPLPNCHDEIEKFCPDAESLPTVMKCLAAHDGESSVACKQDRERLAKIIRQGGGRGSGGLGAGGGLSGGLNLFAPPVPIFTYGGTLQPGSDPTRMENHRVNISAPFYKNATDTYSASIAFSDLQMQDQLVLKDSGVQVPKRLQKAELGVGFSRNLPDSRLLGVRFSLGSASDKPFENGRDTVYSLNTFYSFQTEETKRWAVFLFMSNNTPLLNNIPIPGFMYFYKTDTFTGIFGIPFLSLQWTPVAPWSYSLSLLGPVFNAEIGYGLPDRMQGFVGLSWNPQSFMRNERNEVTDRLFIDEKRIFIGGRMALSEKFAGELQVGTSFDRSIYEGPRTGQDTHGILRMPNTGFANWNFRYMF